MRAGSSQRRAPATAYRLLPPICRVHGPGVAGTTSSIVTWPTTTRSGPGIALAQALGTLAHDTLGDQPGAVVAAHRNEVDAGTRCHVQHQQLRRQVIGQRRE